MTVTIVIVIRMKGAANFTIPIKTKTSALHFVFLTVNNEIYMQQTWKNIYYVTFFTVSVI